MDGIERSKTALRNLSQRRMAVDGLQAEIEQLEADMINASEMGYVYANGEKISPENKMKALVDRKKGLEQRKKALKAHVEHADRVLAAMDERERDVLVTFFCKGLKPGQALRQLEGALHIEQAQVYRIRDMALWRFALRMGFEEGEE